MRRPRAVWAPATTLSTEFRKFQALHEATWSATGPACGLYTAREVVPDLVDSRKSANPAHVSHSAVAHELRRPLTAVRTSIGLLLDKSVQREPQMREQLLQTISQSAERMQRLVTDVLELARARLGGMPLQLRRFDAVALAREVAAPLQSWPSPRPTAARLTSRAP